MDRTSTLSGLTMATPFGSTSRCAASRFGLRPPRLAAHRKTYTTSWDITTMLALVFDKLHFSDVYLPRVDFNLDLVEAEARWIERLSNSTTSAPQCCSHRFAL